MKRSNGIGRGNPACKSRSPPQSREKVPFLRERDEARVDNGVIPNGRQATISMDRSAGRMQWLE